MRVRTALALAFAAGAVVGAVVTSAALIRAGEAFERAVDRALATVGGSP